MLEVLNLMLNRLTARTDGKEERAQRMWFMVAFGGGLYRACPTHVVHGSIRGGGAI